MSLEERRINVWAEYNLLNKDFFDFILHFMEYFNQRWCENFYNHISSSKHISHYKFKRFTKNLSSIFLRKTQLRKTY
jgi:hypothetical protein